MNIDTGCFKAFQSAAKTLNFTEAARLAGMTQSGVSQHISKLEKEIGDSLFYRIGKRVLLTESGQKLIEFIDHYQDSVSELQAQLAKSKKSLHGKVSYAMPESCLLSPHFSLLLKEKSKSFREVELSVKLAPSEQVFEKVRSNEIDFGFVTKREPDVKLKYVEFCEEEYVLVSSQEESPDPQWINYPGHDFYFEIWSKANKKSTTFKNANTSVNAIKFLGHTNSVQAALQMVAQGMGIAIFPAHCVDGFTNKSKLKIHSTTKKTKNMIYIVTLQSILLPARVQKVIDTFMGMK